MAPNTNLITNRHFMAARRIVTILIFSVSVLAVVMSQKTRAQDSLPAELSPLDSCIACHSNPSMTMELPSGEILNLSVNPTAYNSSIHGEKGLTCQDCHTGITGYPHPDVSDSNHRGFTIRLNAVCGNCHGDEVSEQAGSVHTMAIEQKNFNAAVCSDCHGSHLTRPLREQRIQTSHTCQGCHSEIYNLYQNSVHGSALMGAGNPDVPNCISCHGAHDVKGPMNAPFKMDSPMVCAKCHNDTSLMQQYGINTNVWDSWVDDFHGKTYVLIRAVTPDKETDKALCIDCHGVHDMLPPENPASATGQNLIDTCRKCHPRATSKFSTAWLDHYKPSLSHNPLVFFVTWFYRLAIIGILGGMAVFVVTDYMRMRTDFRKERKNNG